MVWLRTQMGHGADSVTLLEDLAHTRNLVNTQCSIGHVDTLDRATKGFLYRRLSQNVER